MRSVSVPRRTARPSVLQPPRITHPVPQLREHFRTFEQMGLTSGRYGYRQWVYTNRFLGVRYGDIIKIDHEIPPRGERGEIVWVEIKGGTIETLGVLESWNDSLLEVWIEPHELRRGSMKDCLPRRVIGKLTVNEMSQRAFLAGRWKSTPDGDAEGRRLFNEVLQRIPLTRAIDSCRRSPLEELLAAPKRGRVLDICGRL